MVFSCRHVPRYTGVGIVGVFGKENLPGGAKPVRYNGDEAFCEKCGCHLIVIQETTQKIIELEEAS